jgi:hypothetical protein
MAEMLAALHDRAVPPEIVDYWRDSEPWLTVREWGWIMHTGELTGFGANHTREAARGTAPRGVLPPRD